MQPRRNTVVLAAAIVLGAANLALEAAKLTPPARAAAPQKYKVMPYEPATREALLNQLANQGWELVAIDTVRNELILEKN